MRMRLNFWTVAMLTLFALALGLLVAERGLTLAMAIVGGAIALSALGR